MARVEVVMPEMGESVAEGTVIEWSKKIGDQVETDEALLEIATDKVDTEVPSPESGILVEILAEEGETIEVGKPIAIIETDPEKAADAGKESSGKKSNKESESTKEKGEDGKAKEGKKSAEKKSNGKGKASSANGERVEITMPQMGESVMEGTIIEWSKKVGDQVEADEALLEIATDKVDTEIPSPSAGTLTEILAESGETVEVGQVIAILMAGEGVQDGATETEADSGSEQKVVQTAESANGEEEADSQQKKSDSEDLKRVGSDGRFYSPLVRSIAREESISQQELESIQGTGKDGRVSKEDILSWLEKRGTEHDANSATKDRKSGGKISVGELQVNRPTENVEIVKMDRMRKMIAEHMVRSKQTSAHVTTFTDVDVTNLVRWRDAKKKTFQEKTGTKLTFTPIFIEAIIHAIREFPLINSSVQGEEIHIKRDINFGLAVALGEGGLGGLIVPVIKQAQDKNLAGLAKSVAELADRARNRNLKPDDLVGGTITLTNYGSVGNLMGTPIINQPQVAIIGTGVIEKRPVVLETDQGDVIAIRHKMYLSMSYDHRIIDGAHGGAFLGRIKQLLEEFDSNKPV
ncbi:MAG: 2-oxoglutarate dehydrogenase, E2 component, dihydrolipoamide succinyltransferase [Balneolaceae bacterium]